MAHHQPTFETRDRKRLYEFITDRGGVTYDDLIDADLLTDPDRYRQLIAVMKRDGLLKEDDGTLKPAIDAGTEETHSMNGTTVTIRTARQEDISGIIGVMRQIASEKRYVTSSAP